MGNLTGHTRGLVALRSSRRGRNRWLAHCNQVGESILRLSNGIRSGIRVYERRRREKSQNRVKLLRISPRLHPRQRLDTLSSVGR
jgi:hypothetical protein